MKKITFILLITFFASNIFSQNDEGIKDTTKIKFGDRTIIIIESDEESKSTKVEEKENRKKSEKENNEEKKKCKSRRNSRWTGLYLGFNQLGTELNPATPLSDGREIWEVNPWKSRVWNFNFLRYSLSIVPNHFLVTTGLGIEWKNYTFKNNIDIEDNDGESIPVVNNSINYKNNKLHSCYFQIPLLLEFNTSKRANRGLYIGAGITGGIRVKSKMYKKYELNGRTVKSKIYDDFNLNSFQAILTARIGFDRLTFFANYDLIPVFEHDKNKGDRLKTFSFGLRILPF